MPKFTLIKEKDHNNDTEVRMTFDVDSSVIAHEYFDDFLRAAGFVLREREDDEGTGFLVRGDLEWDKDGELIRPKNKLKAVT